MCRQASLSESDGWPSLYSQLFFNQNQSTVKLELKLTGCLQHRLVIQCSHYLRMRHFVSFQLHRFQWL